MDHRYQAICAFIREHGAVAVAFSGGADSTLLLALAREALGAERVLAVTAVTPYMVRQEIGDAVGLASELSVRHELVELPMPEGVETNPPDRCYRCKQAMYQVLLARAAELGFRTLMDGSNTDDADDFRPGLRAVRELGVKTPFVTFGIDKDSVRSIARSLDLPTWEKPTNACLLTRLRFNERVSMPRLQQIEEAERFLTARGFTSLRVRCHGDLARIEVDPAERARLLAEAEGVVDALREFGFRFVTIDMIGYQPGSMHDPDD